MLDITEESKFSAMTYEISILQIFLSKSKIRLTYTSRKSTQQSTEAFFSYFPKNIKKNNYSVLVSEFCSHSLYNCIFRGNETWYARMYRGWLGQLRSRNVPCANALSQPTILSWSCIVSFTTASLYGPMWYHWTHKQGKASTTRESAKVLAGQDIYSGTGVVIRR